MVGTVQKQLTMRNLSELLSKTMSYISMMKEQKIYNSLYFKCFWCNKRVWWFQRKATFSIGRLFPGCGFELEKFVAHEKCVKEMMLAGKVVK